MKKIITALAEPQLNNELKKEKDFIIKLIFSKRLSGITMPMTIRPFLPFLWMPQILSKKEERIRV